VEKERNLFPDRNTRRDTLHTFGLIRVGDKLLSAEHARERRARAPSVFVTASAAAAAARAVFAYIGASRSNESPAISRKFRADLSPRRLSSGATPPRPPPETWQKLIARARAKNDVGYWFLVHLRHRLPRVSEDSHLKLALTGSNQYYLSFAHNSFPVGRGMEEVCVGIMCKNCVYRRRRRRAAVCSVYIIHNIIICTQRVYHSRCIIIIVRQLYAL